MNEDEHRQLAAVVVRHGVIGALVTLVGLAGLLSSDPPAQSRDADPPGVSWEIARLVSLLITTGGLILVAIAVVRRKLLDRQRDSKS